MVPPVAARGELAAFLRADGLTDRLAEPWVKGELAFLRAYLASFARAARGAGTHYFVDGFAGPGIHRIRGRRERVAGAPFLSLWAHPPFTRSVLVERTFVSASALARRTAVFGSRAVVLEGDGNDLVVPAIQEHVEPGKPCLCLLDPGDGELAWAVVEGAARFGQPRRVELIVVFPANGRLVRGLPLWSRPEPWVDLTRVYGHDGWRRIYQRRRAAELSPDEARTAFLHLYARGLERLGYRTVLAREVADRDTRRTLFYLFFASDDPAARLRVERSLRRVFLPGREPLSAAEELQASAG